MRRVITTANALGTAEADLRAAAASAYNSVTVPSSTRQVRSSRTFCNIRRS